MPWQETSPVDQRERFIRDHRLALYTMVELCTRYGVSRKTGYNWVERYEAAGAEGLAERSRAPTAHGRAMAADVREAVLALRRAHPRWGPKKLRAILAERA